MTTENVWSKFTKRISIRASTESLYHAWATQTGIESWFLKESRCTSESGSTPATGQRDSDELLQAGDDYRWRWHGWSDDVTQFGKIITANGIDRLQFSIYDPMVVTVSITQEEGESLVELTQENIPDDDVRAQTTSSVVVKAGRSTLPI